MKKILSQADSFDWDKSNQDKSLGKHSVTPKESEEVFFHRPLLIASDPRHSEKEKRYLALGQTAQKRQLFLAFTYRSKKIRIISARPMSRRERKNYEQAKKNPTI
ncbi:MAG: BrnT family toxin [Patescibacteria group bacterium]